MLFLKMLKADYSDIINLCQTFPSFSSICNQDYFWGCKAEEDFNVPPSDLIFAYGQNNKSQYECYSR